MWPSISGRLASSTSAPTASRVSSWPAITKRISRIDLHDCAPAAASSSVIPGSSSSIARCPLASMTCAWLPCGTALRPSPMTGSSSRSTIVTRS